MGGGGYLESLSSQLVILTRCDVNDKDNVSSSVSEDLKRVCCGFCSKDPHFVLQIIPFFSCSGGSQAHGASWHKNGQNDKPFRSVNTIRFNKHHNHLLLKPSKKTFRGQILKLARRILIPVRFVHTVAPTASQESIKLFSGLRGAHPKELKLALTRTTKAATCNTFNLQ